MGKPLTADQRREIQRLGNQGYTHREIAEITGHARSTIGDICPKRSCVNYVDRQKPVPQQVVPKDTRTLSQRLTGEPLPGRSALDRMQAERS